MTLTGARSRYLPHAVLSEGGSAQVRVVVDADGRTRACKIASAPRHDADLEREERLARQVRACAPGASAWLVPVLDAGVASTGRRFLVLPLCEGDLASFLREPSPLRIRLDLLAQVAFALEHLHAAGGASVQIVHGDLTPRNVLLDHVGDRLRARLGDLGAARLSARGSAGGAVDGHPLRYAAPEVHAGAAGELDPAVDVFALGAIVYAALTAGGPPEVAFQAVWRKEEPGAPALADAEIDRLHHAIADDHATAHGLADPVFDDILVPLESALQPDPRRRAGQAGPLRRGLVAAHDRLAAAEGRPAWSSIGFAQEVTAPSPRAPRWPILLVGVTGVAMLALASASRGSIAPLPVAPAPSPAPSARVWDEPSPLAGRHGAPVPPSPIGWKGPPARAQPRAE